MLLLNRAIPMLSFITMHPQARIKEVVSTLGVETSKPDLATGLR